MAPDYSKRRISSEGGVPLVDVAGAALGNWNAKNISHSPEPDLP